MEGSVEENSLNYLLKNFFKICTLCINDTIYLLKVGKGVRNQKTNDIDR